MAMPLGTAKCMLIKCQCIFVNVYLCVQLAHLRCWKPTNWICGVYLCSLSVSHSWWLKLYEGSFEETLGIRRYHDACFSDNFSGDDGMLLKCCLFGVLNQVSTHPTVTSNYLFADCLQKRKIAEKDYLQWFLSWSQLSNMIIDLKSRFQYFEFHLICISFFIGCHVLCCVVGICDNN